MALITNIAPGDWSDPAIWFGGAVPADGDDVIIANLVDYDVDQVAQGFVQGIGIELRDRLRAKDTAGAALSLVIGQYLATGGGIVNDQRGSAGRTVGIFQIGDSLDLGFGRSTDATYKLNFNATGFQQLFMQTESPFLFGNHLQVEIHDKYGHVYRAAEMPAGGYDDSTLSGAFDRLIPQAQVGDAVAIVPIDSRVTYTTLAQAIADNGNGTWQVSFTTITGNCRAQLNNGGNAPQENFRAPTFFWLESNVHIDQVGVSTTATVTASISRATVCARISNFDIVNQSGTGTHSWGNVWYGAVERCGQVLAQGSQNHWCGVFCGGKTNDSVGNFITSNFKNHFIGLDDKSYSANCAQVFADADVAAAAGLLTLRGNFAHFDRMTDNESTAEAYLDVEGARFVDVGYNGSPSAEEMFMAIVPGKLKNTTFQRCLALINPGASDDIRKGQISWYENVTINNLNPGLAAPVITTNFPNDSTDAFEDWIFEDYTLEGVQHELYIYRKDTIGQVTTESSGIPGAGAPANAQRVAAASGVKVHYVPRRIYLRAGETINATAQAYIEHATSTHPTLLIQHEDDSIFNTALRRDIENDGRVLAVDAFHDGAVGGAWQGGAITYTATKEGWHYAIVASFHAPNADFTSDRLMWVELNLGLTDTVEDIANASDIRRELAIEGGSTAAELADISAAINTTGKALGKPRFDITNGQPVWATGANPGDAWNDSDGNQVHAPA